MISCPAVEAKGRVTVTPSFTGYRTEDPEMVVLLVIGAFTEKLGLLVGVLNAPEPFKNVVDEPELVPKFAGLITLELALIADTAWLPALAEINICVLPVFVITTSPDGFTYVGTLLALVSTICPPKRPVPEANWLSAMPALELILAPVIAPLAIVKVPLLANVASPLIVTGFVGAKGLLPVM